MSEHPRETPPPLSWKVCLPPLALCAFLFGLAAVASFVQEEPDTDESVYLAMAEAWAREGSRPYGDFFHAHPPGLLAPVALVFSLVPPSIPAGRVIPLLSLVALFALVLACARTVEREENLPGTTIFAGTLFLTSPLVHLVGAGYLGLNLPAALILGAFLLSFKGKPSAAGFVTGLSLTVRLSTLPVAAVLAVVHRRKPAFFLGAATGCLPLLLSLLLWSGCFGQCVGFHIRKESMFFGARLSVLGQFLYEEKVLLLFAVPALFLLRGRRTRLLLLGGFCVLFFASVQKVVWPYYFHLAVPLLSVPAAAWIAQLLGRRIEGRLLIFPNLAILLAAVAVNSMWILPRLRHDETLLPLVEKAKALAGPDGKVVDLSGGGKGCYLAVKTDLTVAGGQFDMSLHRFRSGSLSEGKLARALAAPPDLVLTEIEAGERTVLWSRLPKVREALIGHRGGGFRPAELMVRANDLSLIVLWVPAERGSPVAPGDTLEERTRRWRFWYVRSTEGRRSKEEFLSGDFGMGSSDLLEKVEALTEGPGRLMARGVFHPPDASQVRWRAEDVGEGGRIRSYVWAQPGGGRLLIETVRAGGPYRPLSFADAALDPATGRLESLRVFGEVGRGIVPVLSIRPADPLDR